jgi:excinuclease ABC subunit C
VRFLIDRPGFTRRAILPEPPRVYAESMMELDREIKFEPERAEEFFESLPAQPAVVVIKPHEALKGARALLLRTADLRRRMRLLLSEPEANSKRLNLRQYAESIRFRVTASKFEQALLHWQQARVLWPGNYRQRLRLYLPAFVKLNLANPYPRAYITRRLAPSGLYVGPFATRHAAENFLEPWLDLFRIRRCQIKIRRDPEFPGCIYSEMKMCLAPCFGGCTPEEYSNEVSRAAAFLRSGGSSLAEELAQERELASTELHFERASALHKRLEKVQELRRSLPELARPIEQMDAVILVRAGGENAIALFTVRGGEIADPFVLQFGQLAGQPRSAEQIIRELLEPATAQPDEATPNRAASDPVAIQELEDHLALLARWFYGTPREGEIFFQEPRPTGWPYRRILRACRRLLSPADNEKPD